MTRRDFIVKWLSYGLALLPVFWAENMILNRFTVFGVFPMLLPLAAISVAVLEGAVSGAGFGLAVGILCDAVYYGANGSMTLTLCLLCCGAGALSQYVLRQGFSGCLLCCAAALFVIDAGRVFVRMFTGMAALPALLRVAIPEILWSLAFVVVVYPLFRWIHTWVLHKLLLY